MATIFICGYNMFNFVIWVWATTKMIKNWLRTTAAAYGTCFLNIFFGKYVWVKLFMFLGKYLNVCVVTSISANLASPLVYHFTFLLVYWYKYGMAMRSCENYLVLLIPICLSLSSVAGLIEWRIHKQRIRVRILEVSESEKLSDHRVGKLWCRKEKWKAIPGGKKYLTCWRLRKSGRKKDGGW